MQLKWCWDPRDPGSRLEGWGFYSVPPRSQPKHDAARASGYIGISGTPGRILQWDGGYTGVRTSLASPRPFVLGSYSSSLQVGRLGVGVSLRSPPPFVSPPPSPVLAFVSPARSFCGEEDCFSLVAFESPARSFSGEEDCAPLLAAALSGRQEPPSSLLSEPPLMPTPAPLSLPSLLRDPPEARGSRSHRHQAVFT